MCNSRRAKNLYCLFRTPISERIYAQLNSKREMELDLRLEPSRPDRPLALSLSSEMRQESRRPNSKLNSNWTLSIHPRLRMSILAPESPRRIISLGLLKTWRKRNTWQMRWKRHRIIQYWDGKHFPSITRVTAWTCDKMRRKSPIAQPWNQCPK